MAEVKFTRSLLRKLTNDPVQVRGRTVGEALSEVLRKHPGMRRHLLDAQGSLQKDIVVFINGQLIEDRHRLSDPIDPASELFILQHVS